MSLNGQKTKLVAIFSVLFMLTSAILPLASILNDDGSTDLSAEPTAPLAASGVTGVERVYDVYSATAGSEMVLNWQVSKMPFTGAGMNVPWEYVPSTPAIADDAVFVRMGGYLYKIDIATGDELEVVASYFGNQMYGHYVDFGDYDGVPGGLIMDGLNRMVYDIDLYPLYSLSNSHNMMVYHDGYIYGISIGSISKYDAADENKNSTKEIKYPIWTKNIMSGDSSRTHYPLFVGGYGLVIGESGGLKVFDLETGNTVSSMSLNSGEMVNNEITYDNGVIYFTTFTSSFLGGGETATKGRLVAIPFDNGTGALDTSSLRSMDLASSQNNSSFVIYDGYGYVLTPGGLHVVKLGGGGLIEQVAFSDIGNRFSRGSISLSTAYAGDEGRPIYIYAVPYDNIQSFRIYKHTINGSTHNVSVETVGGIGTKEFCTEAPKLADGGYIIWHNDSGTLHCYKTVNDRMEITDGDVNVDGIVDARDAMLVSQHVAGSVQLAGRQLELADYNGDGVVDLRDAIAIVKDSGISYPVSFTAADGDTGESIRAKVYIYKDPGMTNAVSGKSLPKGTYYYVANSMGYSEVRGTFTLPGDGAVTLRMFSVPVEELYVMEGTKIVEYLGSEKNVVIPDSLGATEVGSMAFRQLDNLETVTLSDTVTEISSGAFYNCRSLKEVIAGDGNPAFKTYGGILYNKTLTVIKLVPGGVTEVIVPKTIMTVAGGQFKDNTSLKSVYIESGITEIGSSAFSNCIGLESVYLPDTVTKMGNNVFEGCTSLRTISIPGSVDSLVRTFVGCTGLQMVFIMEGFSPSAVGYVSETFDGCESLVSVILPSTLRYIGSNMFRDCESLEYIDLSYVTVMNAAFSGCTALRSVVVGSAINSSISGESLEYVRLTKDATLSGVSSVMAGWPNVVRYIVDPNNVDGMKAVDGAIYSNDGKTLYAYPSSVKSVYAIPEAVENIAANAFRNSNITGLIVYGNVISVGSGAFSNCSDLTEVYFLGAAPPATIAADAFTGSPVSFYSDPDISFSWGSLAGEEFYKVPLCNIPSGAEFGWTPAVLGKELDLSGICMQYGVNGWGIAADGEELFADSVTVTAGLKLYRSPFVLNEGGVLTGYSGLSDEELKDLVIPHSIFGQKVTAIATNVFCNWASYPNADAIKIETVVIEAELDYLGIRAFVGCENLRSIVINKVGIVNNHAFNGCINLSYVEMGGVQTIGTGSDITYVFRNAGTAAGGLSIFLTGDRCPTVNGFSTFPSAYAVYHHGSITDDDFGYSSKISAAAKGSFYYLSLSAGGEEKKICVPAGATVDLGDHSDLITGHGTSWNDSSDGSGTSYQLNETFTLTSDVKLYAIA